MGRLRHGLALALPWALAGTVAAGVAAGGTLMAAVTTVAGLLVAGVLIVLGVFASRQAWDVRVRWAVAAVAVALTWYAATSLFAVNPGVSLVGMYGSMGGTALFVLGAAWLVAGVLCADGRSLRTTLGLVAASGAVFTVAAIVEAVARPGGRWQGLAAGLFDNSNSLGQYLAVAAVCAAAWALASARGQWSRPVGWGLAAVSVGGIALAGSRTGALGVLAGLLFAAALVATRSHSRSGPALAFGSVAFAGGLTAAAVAASTGTFGSAMTAFVGSIGTGRDAIWRACLAQFMKSPVAGSGLQQFTAIIDWSVLSDGGYTSYTTNETHNMVLSLLLGGGIVGVLLAALALGLLLWALVDRVSVSGDRKAPALVVAVPVVVISVGLVGWVAPTVMVVVAAIVGASLRPHVASPDGREAAFSPAWARVPAVAVGIAALVLGAVSAYAVRTHVEYQSLATGPRDAAAAVASEGLYWQWRDPTYLTLSLRTLLRQAMGGDAAARRRADGFMGEGERDKAWAVDLATSAALLARLDAGATPEGYRRYAAVVDGVRTADPSSGLWDALEAWQALKAGLKTEARTRAIAALRYPVDDQTAATMRFIATR